MFDRIDRGLWWDRAWSLVEGCSPVSEGCDHCWAAQQTHMQAHNPNEKIAARKSGLTKDQHTFNGQIRLRLDNRGLPESISKPTAFAVWNDLFHPDVDDHFRCQVLAVMNRCPQHIFIVCTKRPHEAAAFAPRNGLIDDLGLAPAGVTWPDNAWLMFSVENQERLEQRWPHIVECVRFAPQIALSVEPMLGTIDLYKMVEPTPTQMNDHPGCDSCMNTGMVDAQDYYRDWINEAPGYIPCPDCTPKRVAHERLCRSKLLGLIIDWVVCGGETGSKARPLHPEWARSLRDQCRCAEIPFFFKGWGEFVSAKGFPASRGIDHLFEDLYQMVRVGRKQSGRELDGQLFRQVPEAAK